MIYGVFPLQRQAFEYFDSIDAQVRSRLQVKIYSFEKTSNGTRVFVVADWLCFMEEYLKPQQDGSPKGNIYEIIRENFPCRLYFDLEYSKPENSGTNGDDMTCLWINLVSWNLYRSYGLRINNSNVIVLDSSTDVKYSKHVFFVLWFDGKEVLFANNIHAGLFVESIFKELEMDPFGCKNGLFQVRAKGNDKFCCFVDRGVYTRNRAFRIFGCTKYGKNNPFRLLSIDKKRYRGLQCGLLHDPKEEQGASRRLLYESILHRTFIVPLQVNRTLEFDSTNDVLFDRDIDSFLIIFDSRGVCAAKSQPTSPSQIFAAGRERFAAVHGHGKAWSERVVLSSATARSPSPFAALDRFIETLVQTDGVKGFLSSWAIFVVSSSHHIDSNDDEEKHQDEKTVVLNEIAPTVDASEKDNAKSRVEPRLRNYRMRYQIGGYRHCHNVGRPHKSNGIQMEVDFARGSVRQMCWDIDCRGFKSAPVYVPLECLPSSEEFVKLIQNIE